MDLFYLLYFEETLIRVCPAEYMRLKFTVMQLPKMTPAFIQDFLLSEEKWPKFDTGYGLTKKEYKKITSSTLREDYQKFVEAFKEKTGNEIFALGYTYEVTRFQNWDTEEIVKLATEAEIGSSEKIAFVSDIFYSDKPEIIELLEPKPVPISVAK